jgi:hypothetical protein
MLGSTPIAGSAIPRFRGQLRPRLRSKAKSPDAAQITPADNLTIELVHAHETPAMVLIRWPAASTVCDPRRYAEVAATGMRLLAEASTSLAAIRARRRL